MHLKPEADSTFPNLKENEEIVYTLYTTNVEYDNGKTGYMYQLVNSEDGEENEIGFDQLHFVGKGDASDPLLVPGKDFKAFEYLTGDFLACDVMTFIGDYHPLFFKFPLAGRCLAYVVKECRQQ